MPQGNKPKLTLQHSLNQVSIFENEVTRDGETTRFPSISFGKRYKDRNGEWVTGNSVTLRDLPILIRLLQLAQDQALLMDGGGQSEDLQMLLGVGKKPPRASRRSAQNDDANHADPVAGTGDTQADKTPPTASPVASQEAGQEEIPF